MDSCLPRQQLLAFNNVDVLFLLETDCAKTSTKWHWHKAEVILVSISYIGLFGCWAHYTERSRRNSGTMSCVDVKVMKTRLFHKFWIFFGISPHSEIANKLIFQQIVSYLAGWSAMVGNNSLTSMNGSIFTNKHEVFHVWLACALAWWWTSNAQNKPSYLIKHSADSYSRIIESL